MTKEAVKSFEMSEEQQKLFDVLTPLQGEIAINSIRGMNDIDAYKHSRGKCKTVSSMESTVSQILSNPKVAAFIEVMKKAAVSGAVMSRQEMLERLSTLSRVNMSDLVEWQTALVDGDEGKVTEQSMWTVKESAELDPLIASSISEITAGKDGFKIKQHSPLSAMKQLADLAGYNEASKVDHTSSDGSMAIDGLSTEERQARIQALLAKQK